MWMPWLTDGQYDQRHVISTVAKQSPFHTTTTNENGQAHGYNSLVFNHTSYPQMIPIIDHPNILWFSVVSKYGWVSMAGGCSWHHGLYHWETWPKIGISLVLLWLGVTLYVGRAAVKIHIYCRWTWGLFVLGWLHTALGFCQITGNSLAQKDQGRLQRPWESRQTAFKNDCIWCSEMAGSWFGNPGVVGSVLGLVAGYCFRGWRSPTNSVRWNMSEVLCFSHSTSGRTLTAQDTLEYSGGRKGAWHRDKQHFQMFQKSVRCGCELFLMEHGLVRLFRVAGYCFQGWRHHGHQQTATTS